MTTTLVPMAGTRVREGHDTGFDFVLPNVSSVNQIEVEEIWTAPEDSFITKDGKNIKMHSRGDTWGKIVRVDGVPRSGWIAIVHLGEQICRKVGQSEPPANPFPEPVMNLTLDLAGIAFGVVTLNGVQYIPRPE